MKNLFNKLSFTSVIGIMLIACSSNDPDPVPVPENPSGLATVTTSAITAITQTTAVSGGNITSDGGNTISSRGICFATTANPTTSNTIIANPGTTGSFVSNLVGLLANTTYYVRAYAVNSAGTAYGNEMSFTTNSIAGTLPTVTTTAVTAITQTTATSGGNVTAAGTGTITSRGICWVTTANPTTANQTATAAGTTGVFTANMTGLTAGTLYYVRAYATSNVGTAYGNQLTFTTTTGSTGGPVGGNAICNGTQPTTVVQITSSTGKIWMDRNLGASRAATAKNDYQAYGCLYQWGRGNDGHASISYTDATTGNPVNGTTTTLSTTNNPGNALFIEDSNFPLDWRSPANNNLWQGVSGINNPCPSGFRLPTDEEMQAEYAAYSITNSNSAFASIHKFVLAGARASVSGLVDSQGTTGTYWTSTPITSGIVTPGFDSFGSYPDVTNERAYGFPVRCIKN